MFIAVQRYTVLYNVHRIQYFGLLLAQRPSVDVSPPMGLEPLISCAAVQGSYH
jgi:hypothetical protein